MSKWLITPDPDAIYKLAITYQCRDKIDTRNHICHLRLLNDIVEVRDLIREPDNIIIYSLDYEIFSAMQVLDKDSTLQRLVRIKNFLKKCRNPRPFIGYFSEDVANIDNRHIVILDLLDLTDWDMVVSEMSLQLILGKIKEAWIQKIAISKKEVISFLETEMTLPCNRDFREIFMDTMDTAKNFDYAAEVNKLQTVDEVVSYWPTLFLPAPDFVNKIQASIKK